MGITMVDEREIYCPLCAEEMDFTDRQLKPCKCGYEICIWCWHHIIEMSDKDCIVGRCPACRLPYDKERIVGAATNCERVVSDINGDRKQKIHKGKHRVSVEARKQLGSVRVIQRNLVYIIGLPLSLADESLLEHREYFGQYGKVLKVSISRPSSGSQQASNSNTFSVYITYAKEEEAVRCIQAIHNFVLDGKSLKACFGTTKYCHSWLRNMPCSNPDCFYLHDIGSQEDSFSKDEIISAYTRSRVPQIIGNNLQRRSGNMLPPPIDDFYSNGTTSNKILAKSFSSNTLAIDERCSHPNDISMKSTLLPAAASWGTRASHPVSSRMSCLQSPKQTQTDPCRTSDVSPESCSINETCAWNDDIAKQGYFIENHMDFVDMSLKHLESSKDSAHGQTQTPVQEFSFRGQSSAWHDDTSCIVKSLEESPKANLNNKFGPISPSKSYIGRDFETSSKLLEKNAHVDKTTAWDDEDYVVSIPNICSIKDQVSLGGNKPTELLEFQNGKSLGTSTSEFLGDSLVGTTCNSGIGASSTSSLTALEKLEETDVLRHGNYFSKRNDTSSSGFHGVLTPVSQSIEYLRNDLSSMDLNAHLFRVDIDEHQERPPDRKLSESPVLEKHLENITSTPLKKSPTLFQTNHIFGESSDWTTDLQGHFSPFNGKKNAHVLEATNHQILSDSSITEQTHLPPSGESSFIGNACRTTSSSRDITTTDRNSTTSWLSVDNDVRFPGEHQGSKFASPSILETPYEHSSHSASKGNCIRIKEQYINKDVIVDTRESNIISDILSMNFDPWDTSLTASSNILKLLQSDNGHSLRKISTSLKGQNSSQSRFSFARQENDLSRPNSIFDVAEISQNEHIGQEHLGLQNCITRSAEPHPILRHVQPVTQSDKNPDVARIKVSVPPGFSFLNRSPPPGFSSQDRFLQDYITPSGTSIIQNQYHMPLPNGADDLELIDPAILVCKASGQNTNFRLRSFPSDVNISGNDLMYQLMARQNIPRQKAQLICSQAGGNFVPKNDAYFPEQLMVQNYSDMSHRSQMPSQAFRDSVTSNRPWDEWNGLQNQNDFDTSELLKMPGYNKYIPVSEEQIFVPGNFYNRSFGI